MSVLCVHPSTPASWLDYVNAGTAWHQGGGLCLTYRLHGALDQLKLPAPGRRERQDELWRQTCCEAFIQGDDRPAYHEYNLSPSGAWAAYRFQDYRQGGVNWMMGEPDIACGTAAREFTLQATIDAASLPPGEILRVGLAVVVESHAGDVSYWALQHVPERADFHDAGAFMMELPRP